MRLSAAFAVVVLAVVCVERTGLAQTSPTSRNGVTGSASSLGIGSGAFGTSATTGGTGLGSGAAAAGFGGAGIGSSFSTSGTSAGFAQGMMATTIGATAAQQGNGTGFIGANNSTNSFIGGMGQSTQGAARQNSGGQNRGGNARGGNNGAQNLMNLLNGMGGGAGGNQANTAPVIRPRQKVAFDFPAPPAQRLQTAVTRQVSFVSKSRPQFKDIQVTTGDAGEIVLTGAVASERDSRLAAKLARLEPGVRTVRNELTFPPSAVEE